MQVGSTQLKPGDKKVKGKRSRTGCRTCRRRKKRCDETRPICSTCQRLHLECEYPEPGTENRNQTRKRSVADAGPSSRAKRPAKAAAETGESDAETGLPPKSPPKREPSTPLESCVHESAFNRFLRNRKSDVDLADSDLSPSPAREYASPSLAAVSSRQVEDQHIVFPLHISEPSNRGPMGPTPPPLGLEMPYLLLNDYQRYGPGPEPELGPSFDDLDDPFDSMGPHHFREKPQVDLNMYSPPSNYERLVMPPHYSSASSAFSESSYTPTLTPAEETGPTFLVPDHAGSEPPNVTPNVKPNAKPNAKPNVNSPNVNSPNVNSPHVTPSVEPIRSEPPESIERPVPLKRSVSTTVPTAIPSAIPAANPSAIPSAEPLKPSRSAPARVSGPVLSASDLLEMSKKQVHPGVAIPVSGAPTTDALRTANPDLSEEAVALYEYFRDKQSLVISVSPLNNFRAVFMTISIRSRIVLYSLLAWAGWHAGLEEAGRRYFQMASTMLRANDAQNLSKEEILATLILLASAKICSGDVSDWRNYMMWAGETIQRYGGISCFMESESVLWLLKNFAYKEILTSAASRAPTLFSSLEFEFIFAQPLSPQFPDTLLACCEPLFVVLAITNEMAREVREMAKTDRVGLETVFKKAHRLEDTIRQSKPDPRQLASLDPDERSRQVRLFDVYKLVVLLYIYHSVLHTNSATLRVRYINLRLVEALPSLLGTSVDGILTFPLFIAGICCADAGARLRIMDMFDAFLRRISMRNVQQAQHLVCEVWKLDEMGERYVDWGALLESQGLNIAFV